MGETRGSPGALEPWNQGNRGLAVAPAAGRWELGKGRSHARLLDTVLGEVG